MDPVVAAAWGAAGGMAAGLINLSVTVVGAGYKWPWRGEGGEPSMFWPWMFVAWVGVAIGAVVAAAASGQMAGPWPAMILGASAPSVIRGILGQIEVAERKPEGGGQSGSDS